MYHRIFVFLVRFTMFRRWLASLIKNSNHVRLIAKPDNTGYVSYLRLSYEKELNSYYYRYDGLVDIISFEDMLLWIEDFLKNEKVQLRKTQFDYHKVFDEDNSLGKVQPWAKIKI